jgi:hypothetical protein
MARFLVTFFGLVAAAVAIKAVEWATGSSPLKWATQWLVE